MGLNRAWWWLALAPLAVSCQGSEPAVGSQEGMSVEALSEAERVAVLEVVNAATFTELDVDAALDKRAAENIIAHRDGADGTPGTADDDLFDTVEELDAVKWVGEATLAQLVAYAESLGLLEPEAGLSADDVAAILAVANTASFEQLDVDAALDKRAAENIVAHRVGPDASPGTADDDLFDTLDELDAISYVGDAAIAKLLAYALEQGTTGAPCVLISEYIESAQNTDALELFNCGTTPVEQSQIGVCLVRNDDTTCTITNMLSPGTLAPGEVWELCRTQESVPWLPSIRIAENCRQVMAGIMNVSGDDRLLVFHDTNGDGAFSLGTDTPLDAFGVIAQRPPSDWWKNMDLRRCNPQPFDGFNSTEFYRWDYYEMFGDGQTEDFGVPPTLDGCP